MPTVELAVLPGVASAAASSPADPETSDSDGDGQPDAQTRMAAAILAAELETPVEDLSARTESATTVVNPDGSMTMEDFGGPVRLATEGPTSIAGQSTTSWTPVDYTLTETAGGQWRPVASPADVVVNGVWNGTDEAARVTLPDGSAVSVWWPAGGSGSGDAEGLPTPSVDGSVATYALEGYSGSVDLVVGMTTSGVSALVRINEELTADETASIEEHGVTFGIRTTGIAGLATASEAVAEDPSLAPEVPGGASGNGLVVTDADGALVTVTPELSAWDNSSIDAMGNPAETVALDSSLEAVGSTGTGDNLVVAHELTVTPPTGFLTDSSTEYPIVIDPEIQSLTQTQDTWVRNGIGGTNGSDESLLVGRAAAAPTNPAHSFLLFNGHSLTGMDIANATIGMYQYQSGSCAPKTLTVHGVNGTWAESTMTWSNQPGVHPSGFGTTTANRSSNCPGGMGYTTVNVTPIVQNWADNQASASTGYVNRGFRLSTPGTDTTFERRFCSMNYNSTTAPGCLEKKPYLKVTYNVAPSFSAMPQPVAGSGRDQQGTFHVATGRPTFVTYGVDDDGTSLQHYIEARSSTTSSVVAASCTSSGAAFSNQEKACQLGTTLTQGANYVVRARATDSNGRVGPWSSWLRLKVNNTTPTIGAITCSNYQNSTWYADRPAPTATCTVGTTGVGDVSWIVNGKAATTAAVGQSGASTLTVNVPTSGWTDIAVRGATSAGVKTSWRRVEFGTGSAGLNEPASDYQTSTTVPIQASAPAGATSARVEWRVAPATSGDTNSGWANATHIVDATTGAAWNGQLPSVGGGATVVTMPRVLWNSRQADVPLGSLVQVRVTFEYGTSWQSTQIVRVNVVPSNFTAATPLSDFGGQTAELVTGELRVDEWDVTEMSGVAPGLSVGRSHLSFGGEIATNAQAFGPSWLPQTEGIQSAASQYILRDRTQIDGTIQLLGSNGSVYAYSHVDGARGAQRAGVYELVAGTEAPAEQIELTTVVGVSGISHRVVVPVDEGNSLTFARTTTGASPSWRAETVRNEQGLPISDFRYDSSGRLQWIVSSYAGSVACIPPSTTEGCVAFEFLYSGSSPSVTQIQRRAHLDGSDAVTSSPTTTVFAKYEYSPQGELASSWDPRLGDGTEAQKTQYSYASVVVGSRTIRMLQQIESPNATTSFAFNSEGRISSVAEAPIGESAAVSRIVYGVPLSGGGLPDLTAAGANVVRQSASSAPVGASAVFDPGYSGPVSGQSVDWSWAEISYFDAKGRTTHVATNPTGEAWLIAGKIYDDADEVIEEFDTDVDYSTDPATEIGSCAAHAQASNTGAYICGPSETSDNAALYAVNTDTGTQTLVQEFTGTAPEGAYAARWSPTMRSASSFDRWCEGGKALCREIENTYIGVAKANYMWGNARFSASGSFDIILRNNINGRQPRYTVTYYWDAGPTHKMRKQRVHTWGLDRNKSVWSTYVDQNNGAFDISRSDPKDQSQLIYADRVPRDDKYDAYVDGKFSAEGTQGPFPVSFTGSQMLCQRVGGVDRPCKITR